MGRKEDDSALRLPPLLGSNSKEKPQDCFDLLLFSSQNAPCHFHSYLPPSPVTLPARLSDPVQGPLVWAKAAQTSFQLSQEAEFQTLRFERAPINLFATFTPKGSVGHGPNFTDKTRKKAVNSVSVALGGRQGPFCCHYAASAFRREVANHRCTPPLSDTCLSAAAAGRLYNPSV